MNTDTHGFFAASRRDPFGRFARINADYKLEQDTQRYTQIDAEEKQEIRGEEIEEWNHG
jgi:hypothetical protein